MLDAIISGVVTTIYGLSIVYGVYSVKNKKYILGIIFLLFGLTKPIYSIAATAALYYTESSLYNDNKIKSLIQAHKNSLEADTLKPIKKYWTSRVVAEYEFINNGKFVEIYDTNGTKDLYRPDSATISMIKTRIIIDNLIKNGIVHSVFWVLYMLVAIFLGNRIQFRSGKAAA